MEMEAAIEEGSDDGSEEDAKTELNLNRKIPSLTNEQTHYAVKVYKTTLAGFKNRAEYVKNDFRFKNPRRVMKVWAEKEFLNLQRFLMQFLKSNYFFQPSSRQHQVPDTN
jgi:serine/threonine-protein kinase RIO1